MPEGDRGVADASLPLEPYQLISQYTLELSQIRGREAPQCDVRYGTSSSTHPETADGVTARVRSGRHDLEITTLYLAGCDGGGEPDPQQLGIGLKGTATCSSCGQALYRCDDLYDRIPIGRAATTICADASHLPHPAGFDEKHFTCMRWWRRTPTWWRSSPTPS